MKRSLVLLAIAIGALACQGPRGPEGPQGPTGPTGMRGSAGSQGVSGAQGPQGVTGSQGMTGSQGQAAVPDSQANPPVPGAGWVALRQIHFTYDDPNIRPSEMKKISEIAAYLNDNPSSRLGIDGTTDLRRGTNKYNVSLSAQREANVRDALLRAGVPADRMQIGSYAAEPSQCTNRTEDCAQRDGRVDVLATS